MTLLSGRCERDRSRWGFWSKLKLIKFGRGVASLDTGTPDAMLESAQYFAAIEHRQGLKVACLEEVAYRMGYIDANQVSSLAERYNDEYRKYLLGIASDSRTAKP